MLCIWINRINFLTKILLWGELKPKNVFEIMHVCIAG